MVFKDKLREKRIEANLTQAELAKLSSVHVRTIQNYETGMRRPANIEKVQNIAEALHTTPEYLLGTAGSNVVEAHEKGGAKAARDMDELVREISGMFVGGELSEDAVEGAMRALTEAYWIAKDNKKYAPKKNGTPPQSEPLPVK